ncbi:MarR family transcriptional regulator [Vibrio cholerae]|nr:MarR family transcriptional regulator [Vibrio cholerae]
MDSVQKSVMEWANELPELNTLPMSVLHRLQRLARRIELKMEALYQQAGLTAGEFEVLMTLRGVGHPYCLNPSDLQVRLLLSSGAMTNRLTRLERKGLVERNLSRYDRRNVEVTLTEVGRQRIELWLPEYCDLQSSLLAKFSEVEQEALSTQLQEWLSHHEQLWCIPDLLNSDRQR